MQKKLKHARKFKVNFQAKLKQFSSSMQEKLKHAEKIKVIVKASFLVQETSKRKVKVGKVKKEKLRQES